MASRVRQSTADAERAVFASDFHVPYADPVAVELWLAFIRWFKPHTVFLIGDVLDCYPLSRYERDPHKRLGMQEELNAGKALLAEVRKSAGKKARVVYLDGNHEHRAPKLLCNLPELSSLDDLRIPALLRLADLGIEHHGYHEQLWWHGLLAEHGDRASKHSGYTAKAMLEARGVSGIAGHCHRLGSHYRTDHNGVKLWLENGCMCRVDNVEYLIGTPNWQQGFTVAWGMKGRGRVACQQVPIISRRIFFNGRVWEA